MEKSQDKRKSVGARASVAKRQSAAKRPSIKKGATPSPAEEEEEEDEEAVVTLTDYALRDPLLFGDYRNAVNESEPRFYEDLLDYKAIYFLFQEVNKT